jgi:two-component system OmpR family response regulator
MSNLLKILLVEDDRSIAGALAIALKSSYDIDIAASGKLAMYKAANDHYDLVILDLTLPDTNGMEICQKLRQRGFSSPILILSGESRVLTKIGLLDAGANDYLTKPFSLGELTARLRALSRRQAVEWPASEIEISGVKLDSHLYKVSRDRVVLSLRPKEFALLEYLMRHAGEVISRDELINGVWQYNDNVWTNTLDVHIKYLRDKLDKPFKFGLITTVHGRGYRFEIIDTPHKQRSSELYASK